jgi:hypothetical protein
VKLSLKQHTQMTEVEELAMKVTAYFVTYPDELKLDLIYTNKQGESEVIGTVVNPKLRGMYEQLEWIVQRHVIKTKDRTVKVGKD